MTVKETSIINSAKDELVNFTSKINPFTQKIGKGLYQVRQYATEKLGTAEDITQLPQEYKDLEKRVDALCDVYTNLLRVTKTYGVQSYDYPESILSVTNHILSSNNDSRAPKTLSHALSRAASSSSIEGVYATALSKYAEASDKLGNARLVMDHEIITNFNEKMQHTQRTSIHGVVKARREVAAKRLYLDAARSKYNGMGLEVEAAEDQFVGAVEQSTHLMKALLQDPEPLRDLTAMAQAQLSYFKEAEELFSALLPELSSLLTTQETTYRHSSSSGGQEE
ncbi:hypothetical protein K501DRAFT_253373 [Backusella circina FSU 941]|nr:hypothetical protein K501DRAFT_253373 [Backusella circina FSU 941]